MDRRAVTSEPCGGVDIARFYYEQRGQIAADREMLEALIGAINAGNDLRRAQWAQWYSVALGFQPDLIVELGRANGNSTALFCQAASRLGRTRVVSLCNSTDWIEESLPRVKAVVPPGWLDRLDARITDILDVDYEQLFAGSARVLVLWDAHGFEIAETVLGRILPLIADRPHLVLMHDISDNRHAAISRSYEGQPLWKGSTWDKGVGGSTARVNIGWMNSLQDQVVALADFAARNDLEIGSADHEYARYFDAHPHHAAEMRELLGDDFFSLAADYAFLSLAGAPPPLHYPAVQRRLRWFFGGGDIARFYYEQRGQIAADREMLEALIGAINAEYDLKPAQWAQWYSVALGFQPDLIVELGRSKGNSTALFCQAASRLGRTRVVSLCNSKDWIEQSLPRVKAVVPPGWLDRLDARITDILDVDYEQLFAGSARVLVLWDAHGFEIAGTVLGRILPLIADRPHLLLMHDISDNRHAGVSRSYEGQPLWNGSTWDSGVNRSTARLNIGWMNSLQDQVVAIADFATRNDLEIGSADHEYAGYFDLHPHRAAEMRQLLGHAFFSLAADYAFLSLPGAHPPFHYPAVQRRFRHQCAAAIRDIHPKRWWPRSTAMPRAIRTNPVKWEYAAVMECNAREEIPADAARSMMLRLQVLGAPVGVGLLSADRSTFVESRRILPGIESVPLLLPVADISAATQLVVQTWDVPEPARVRIEEITFVW